MEGERAPNAKAKLTEVNSYLTCPLCKGYFIDATTIVECLHSFCRSCIIQHLQQDSYCPICELMINTAKPNFKPDKTLQHIVYKLVPGLYASEMSRRRRFWADRPEEAAKVSCPEARGLMTERIIFSPQDAISLSIEYTSDEQAAWNRSEPDPEVPLRRYLQCPAMLRVEHLKKFICNKYNVDNQQYHVDILYKRVPLPDHYTLMDIAYIYSWKRNEPMKFFFRITDIALVSERFDYFESSSKLSSTPMRCPQQRTIKQHTIAHNNNNIEKKSSPERRLHAENKHTSTNIIKTCDSDNKIKENSEHSDKTECGDKKDNEVINSDEKRCEIKCEDSDKEKLVIDKQNDSETSDKEDKQNSENSETNITDVGKKEPVDKRECEMKVEKDSLQKDKTVKICNESNNSDSSKTDPPKTNCSKTEVLNNNIKVPIKDNSDKSESSVNKLESIKMLIEQPENSNILGEKSVENLNKSESNNITPVLNESVEDFEKSQFLKSIQLTAKNSSPPALKPISPEIIQVKITAQKRKYVRKNEKSPNSAKKPKLSESKLKEQIKSSVSKMRKIATKDLKISENDSTLKIKNIKNPIVRLMVSNLNKQATNLTKLVGQADGIKLNNATITDQSDKLQSLIDSCKLNIPSSLSITLTESPRNEDGSIEIKPAQIKPVQNYIEILKLPDKNIAEILGNSVKSLENITETPKKSDGAKNDINPTLANQNLPNNTPQRNSIPNNQKHTFQTMFEETVKKNESIKAQLFHIQNQAKKAATTTKLNVPKPVKKQQNNALDLSKTSPNSETSSPSPSMNITNSNIPNLTVNNFATNSQQNNMKISSNNATNNSKRNILEIAHQLSKKSRLETDLKMSNTTSNLDSNVNPNLGSNPNSKLTPKVSEVEPKSSSPPQQIIINSNFSSGGSISIKKSPKKMPIPRLPISKVPTPKLNPPNVRNGGLLKFSNYTAKLATSANNSNSTNLPKSPTKSPSNVSTPKLETQNNTIHGLTPNQLLEKYNITNLAQFNANLNQAQLAFQQALMVSHQLEMHRMQNSQKHWMSNPNILAHYENYVQSLKNQQNQIIGHGNKN